MNDYKYADIEIGHEESFSVIISQDMLDKFKAITGDINPLHNDDDFAMRGGMKARWFMAFLCLRFIPPLQGFIYQGNGH